MSSLASDSQLEKNFPTQIPIILSQHEKEKDGKTGGHTIARHVGKSIAELRSRLAQSTRLKSISTFDDLSLAEFASTEWFGCYLEDFKKWLNKPAKYEARFSKEVGIPQKIGVAVKSDDTTVVHETNRINLTMIVKQHNNMPHYILTAFPVLKKV